ncbi:putative DNA binding protein [Hibiscus syriacus]|uniref:DNA binding protein n=1 Tax=Hibiscus syriacus TaxID=106335 RepID=A0A6A2WSH6_HIBSY|nr:uncharacterized protein At5g39865-like [Hibiscus syriacus]KAE8657570.1 putative DNA binding protein [Hibiscus syriacus]
MAEMRKNKAKSLSSPSFSPGFLYRSFTMYATPYTFDTNHSKVNFFRKNQQSQNQPASASKSHDSMNSVKGKVKKLCSLFESDKSSSSSSNLPSPKGQAPKPLLRASKSSISPGFINPTIRLPGTEDRIVVYLTSLRGIRRTYEDCYAVKMIFRGFRLWIDERDISMDAAYKKELQSILKVRKVTLPQVFIKGKYIGGADVIKSMFEMGELAKILDDFPRRQPGFVCNSCGDVRFVPCVNCNGSRKLFDDDVGFVKRCFKCNENGLIRCPYCCD